VLESGLTLRQVGGDQPGLAGLAQAVEPLSLVALRRLLLGLSQRLELLPREEVGVAGDDFRALRDLLLPDPDGAAFLGALEQIALKPGLVIGWANDCGDAHRRANLPDVAGGTPYLIRGQARLLFTSS